MKSRLLSFVVVSSVGPLVGAYLSKRCFTQIIKNDNSHAYLPIASLHIALSCAMVTVYTLLSRTTPYTLRAISTMHFP